MSLLSKIKTIFRGDVPLLDLPREVLRRKKMATRQKQERRELDKLTNTPVKLSRQFASASLTELLTHFRGRNVSFFPVGERSRIAKLQTEFFPSETQKLIANADAIVKE